MLNMGTKTLTYKTLPDGQELPADVYWSFDVPRIGVSRPIALIFHGGGFSIGSRSDIPTSQVQTLLSYGFIVVSPDYRLCPQISLLDGPLADSLDAFIWAKESLPSLLAQELDEETKIGLILDPKRTVALGSSAGGTIALWLGSQPNPPSAIADFSSAKYLHDPFFSSPLAPMANTPPNTPSSFQSQVYAGPQVLSTPTSKPDFSNPRFAWLYSAMRDGTWLRDILKGQDVRSVDPVEGFGTAFPPTVFVGGERDFHVPIRFLERACEELRGLGVECVFIRADGQGHLFEWKLKVESEVFGSYVLPALEFLRDQCF